MLPAAAQSLVPASCGRRRAHHLRPPPTHLLGALLEVACERGRASLATCRGKPSADDTVATRTPRHCCYEEKSTSRSRCFPVMLRWQRSEASHMDLEEVVRTGRGDQTSVRAWPRAEIRDNRVDAVGWRSWSRCSLGRQRCDGRYQRREEFGKENF